MCAYFGFDTFFGIALGIGIIIVLVPTHAVILLIVILLVIFVVALSIISSALGAIFKLALFEYARTGVVPAGFSTELVQNAVQGKV